MRIALIVFDGTKLLDVAGPLQVFSDAKRPCGAPAYEVTVLSSSGGSISTDTVCKIETSPFADFRNCQWDTVLVSGGDCAYSAMYSEALQTYLENANANCRRLGSICLGAFILAAGGFLENRMATTHWDGCSRLASAFPDVSVEDNAIFVEDRGIWTSAGVTAGIDMALEMVKQDFGAAEALRLAKSLVLPMMRSGGQRQYSAALASQTANKSERFAALLRDITANIARKHTVASMAASVAMSERNFSRRFVSEFGISPASFVESLRVDFATSLLHNKISLRAVQAQAGFTSDEQMRRAFQRQIGVSPSAYATKFAPPKS